VPRLRTLWGVRPQYRRGYRQHDRDGLTWNELHANAVQVAERSFREADEDCSGALSKRELVELKRGQNAALRRQTAARPALRYRGV
jgi:hypothetical protein